MHQWGAIAAIDGPVALFTPAVIDADTRERIRAALCATAPAQPRIDAPDLPAGNGIRDAARVRLLAGALLLLALAAATGANRDPLSAMPE
ncbi:hypothetical protein [Nocardia inohanensis]|uniref:hypothetical protein n=1 Tax=Nocardia inohanensis TaxID=209246 RepID=UPI00082E54AA|nr:hypothetical protein [Nocardia inohanensis]